MTSELILLVDDGANIVQLARLYLEREGYRVNFAGDGLIKSSNSFHTQK